MGLFPLDVHLLGYFILGPYRAVIYDDALTDAFVTKVLELLPPHGVLYLALEKRYAC